MAEPTASVTLLIASWLTPSSLFIFVNLVIGTIAITSRFTSSPNNRIQEHELQHPFTRSPSLLQRVRSFRLTHQYTYDTTPSTAEPGEFTQPQLVRTSSLLERVRSFNFSLHKHETTETSHAEKTDHNQAQAQAQAQTNQPESEEPEKPKEVPQLRRTPSLLQRLQSMNFSRLYRGEEEPEPAEASGSGSDPSRKDAEMRKSASERGHSERVEDEESVERRRPATTRESTGEDEEVDAKADDFINRFKKQLRLQRVDSILRYREMLRGN
ncbi:hypothetical protein AHAS_Ahas01G0203900 [Arachis hypogaea]